MTLAIRKNPLPDTMRVCVTRLGLSRFRSYQEASLATDAGLVALQGVNGAGKTNLLEALSYFAPGRGLRRARLGDVAHKGGNGSWSVHAVVDGPLGETRLGTGLEGGAESVSRICRIDRYPVSSSSAFADHIRLVWLTPEMGGLFSASAGERRRFLDRLVLAVDAEHGTRVAALERALRSRNRLLEDNYPNPTWLSAIERETAELAVAVAAARSETVARLATLIEADKSDGPFPWARIHMQGALEAELAATPALEVEDRYRATLQANRNRDRAAGRATEGPHLSDLAVFHGPLETAAAECSTGQQKALLVSLILAHAKLVTAMAGFPPLVLLDEIAAHLDPLRRAALYAVLAERGGQVWVTGADPHSFHDLPQNAAIFEVSDGHIAQKTR